MGRVDISKSPKTDDVSSLVCLGLELANSAVSVVQSNTQAYNRDYKASLEYEVGPVFIQV